ncbi:MULTISPECIES: glycerophosphodiester phosphodiesterase [Bacillus]|uniref:glycerophosphodiester phosphodiesterase n=1 Tax=Bacillus TaxID=1386 RepID=UPI0002D64D40|nr:MULTISPECIES: glycerophosphodiester phosphodiesterase family protein [Bacillus]
MMFIYLLLVIITLVLSFYLFKRSQHASKSLRNKPFVIAHRGSSGDYPENTHSSFQAAIDCQADFIEFDIQLTKDLQFVVIHDQTLERTTNGQGKVSDCTLKELQELDAGSWKSPTFSTERIPSLLEVLEKYHGKTKFLIEVKFAKNQPKYADLLVNLLDDYQYIWDDIIIQSFNVSFLRAFHKKMPQIAIGVLVRHQYHGLSEARIKEMSSFATFINPKITMANKQLLSKIFKHSAHCFIWTVKNKQDFQKLERLHPTGIVTDYPEWYKSQT